MTTVSKADIKAAQIAIAGGGSTAKGLEVQRAADHLSSGGNLRAMFDKLRGQLNASFPERRDLVNMMLACLVAGQHILVLGEPGTAKSAIINALCRAIKAAQFFGYLMTRFTEPSEVLGTIDIKLMSETGRQKLVTKGRLPESFIAFLDEVFKSNSAILNALLTIINERRVFDDGAWRSVPTSFIACASNEVPEAGDTSVQAFYDRICARVIVPPIQDDNNMLAVINGTLPKVDEGQIEIADVLLAQRAAAEVPLSAPASVALLALRRDTRAAGIIVSDRRWSQATSLLRAHAWLNGESAVPHTAITILSNVLWSRPEHVSKVEELVRKHAPSYEVALQSKRKVLDEQAAVFGRVDGMKTKQQAMEAIGGVQDVLDETRSDLDDLAREHPDAAHQIEMLRTYAKDLEERAVAASVRVRTKKT